MFWALCFVLLACDRATAQYYVNGYSSIDYDPGTNTVTVNAFSYVDYYVSFYYTNGLSFSLYDPDGNSLAGENINGSLNPIEVNNYSVPGNGCGNYALTTYHWVFLQYSVQNYWINGQYYTGNYNPTPWTPFSEAGGPTFPYYYYREFSLQGNGPEQVTGDTFQMLDYYDTYSDNTCFAQEIERVEYEVIGGPIDDHPAINGLTSTNKGKRIYPDKEHPTTDTTDRTKLRVKATVTPAASGVKLYFKTFDLDDPSTNTSPLDPNGSYGDDNKGNVGGSKAGQLSNCSIVAGTDATACFKTTDLYGQAVVDLTVTKHPGDNFAVAVSKNWSAYLRNVSVDGINLKKGVQTLPVYTASVSPPPTTPANPAMRTELLTVWRRLHVELDSMGPVSNNFVSGTLPAPLPIDSGVPPNPHPYLSLPGLSNLEVGKFDNGRVTFNKGNAFAIFHNDASLFDLSNPGQPVTIPQGTAFKVYDDDDFDSDDTAGLNGDTGDDVRLLSDSLDRFSDSDSISSNPYAAAYITPKFSWAEVAGYNDNSVTFSLNIDDSPTSVSTAINLSRQSRNCQPSCETDDFWVAYLLVAYQSEELPDSVAQTPSQDGDPDGSYTPGIAEAASLVDTISQCSQVVTGSDGGIAFIETMRDAHLLPGHNQPRLRTVPHEIGHQFGLKGDAPGFGLMGYGSSDPLILTDAHLNIIRCRVKSPGR